jgi:hypothetical protein
LFAAFHAGDIACKAGVLAAVRTEALSDFLALGGIAANNGHIGAALRESGADAKTYASVAAGYNHIFAFYAEGIGHAGDGRGFNDHPFNSFQVKVEFSFPYFMADILFYHQQKTIVHKMKTSAMPV